MLSGEARLTVMLLKFFLSFCVFPYDIIFRAVGVGNRRSEATGGRINLRPRIAPKAALIEADFQAEALQFSHQHVEALRHVRLGHIIALDDLLLGLRASLYFVRLVREHLLQRMSRTVSVQRPDLHLTETLDTKLGLTTKRLLRDEAIGPY